MLRVGDRVKIREDLVLGTMYGSITYIDAMFAWDTKHTVTSVSETGNVNLDDGHIFYSPQMLKKLKKKRVPDVIERESCVVDGIGINRTQIKTNNNYAYIDIEFRNEISRSVRSFTPDDAISFAKDIIRMAKQKKGDLSGGQ